MRKKRNEKNEKTQVQKKSRKRRIAEKVQQVIEDGGVQVELVRAREVPTPHIGVCLFFLFCLLLAAAAISCCLYHPVPYALELSTLWQPRYNGSRAQQVCVDHFYACVRAWRMRVMCVL